jgi:acyl-CoA reductase-like NAD-dependent aldehyde dehydrogenase
METLTKARAVVPVEDDARCEIEAIVGRARVAQAAIEDYTQEQADALVTAVGWQVYKSREELAKLAVEEGGFGNVQDKIAKFANRVMGTLVDMASIRGRPGARLGQDRQAGRRHCRSHSLHGAGRRATG